MTPVRTAARAMLAGIFVSGGFKAVTNPDPLVKGAEPVAHRVAPLLTKVHEKVPTDPRTLVQLNGAVQIAGGLLLPTRLHRLAALALIASIVPTTAAGHRFWEREDPAERQQQQIHFLKNLGLLGGLLLAMVDTDGRPGLRWRAGHLARHTDRAIRRGTKKVRLAAVSAELGRRVLR